MPRIRSALATPWAASLLLFASAVPAWPGRDGAGASHVAVEDLRPAGYTGTPFADARVTGGPQVIPGRVRCAWYDAGGEGVAYHDSDSTNNGSGRLNQLDGSYLHAFRKDEGVDTSYTKFRDAIDDHPYNLVSPEPNLLYVGWTEPGEWFNLTVQVKAAGRYAVGLWYTSNRGGTIALELNGAPLAGPLEVPTTFDARDPLAWRQWHHWNRLARWASVSLPEGTSVLTVKVLTKGNMNLESLEFTPE